VISLEFPERTKKPPKMNPGDRLNQECLVVELC